MVDLGAFGRGLAKALGSALTEGGDEGDMHLRPYNLVVTVPIKAPNKRLVEDTCKMAAQRVKKMSGTLLAAASIDPRIKVDGDVGLKVESR